MLFLFDGMVNGTASWIFLSDSSLLVHRNSSDFCVLILCPATLLTSLLSSSSFLVASLEFSVCGLVSSAVTALLLLFQFGFISFSSLITMARTSKTLLNKSDESGHSYLVSNLKGNAFSFSLLSMMLADGLHISLLLCWGMFPLCSLFAAFIINSCWILSKAFSAYTEMIVWFLSLQFVSVMYHIDWFANIENYCIPGIKPTWSRSVSLKLSILLV